MTSNHNRFELTATLVARAALRYTPAGLPVCDLELSHSSTQNEAGVLREVSCTVQALALGVVASQLETLALGQLCHWFGFLAPRSQRSKTLVFHVCSFVHAAQ